MPTLLVSSSIKKTPTWLSCTQGTPLAMWGFICWQSRFYSSSEVKPATITSSSSVSSSSVSSSELSTAS